MEKFSSIDRVVGKVSEETKEQILHDKGERFDNQIFEELKGKERAKTPEEMKIISLVNEATNEIRERYGLEPFNIPSQNIHVIRENDWPDDNKNNAFFNPMLQGVAMRERISRIAFMKSIFHDMLHFKSYGAVQITKGENPELDEYRLGLTVRTRDGKNKYFTNLNEAVTEEMTIRFARDLLSNPLFTDEVNQTKKIIKEHSQAVTSSGKPLFDEDTFYAEIQSGKSWKESIGRLFGNSNVKISTERFTYKKERQILKILIKKIFDRNPKKFRNSEEVFEIFAKGMMTGNILPIGRLIERTFGNGTLRRIGELDQDIDQQKEFVESL